MSRAHIVTPAELSSLRDLELLARTTVEGLRQGLHRSPFHGYSAEFSQYRHYRPGDDLKHVDWKAFAKTNRLYSRQFRETTNMGALFVIDVSRSMAFPEQGQSKFTLAQAAAAVLATLVIDQGDAAGLLAATSPDARDVRYVPPRSGRHHLHLCLATLARLSAQGTHGFGTTVARAATLLRRRGLVVLLSDFYEEESAIAEVRRLARMGHDIVVIHVLARDELQLPAGGAVEFEDLESGARMVTNADAVAAQYRDNVQVFLRHVEQSVVGDGLDYLRLVTGDPVEASLRRFLVGRRGGE